jgi:hypothetical protein
MSSTLRSHLRARLTEAMRERDRELTSALRGIVGALENAEAVPTTTGPVVATSAHVAGATDGIGGSEAPRRELGETEQREIVVREVDELRAAASSYDEVGAADRADALRRAAAAVSAVLEEEPC